MFRLLGSLLALTLLLGCGTDKYATERSKLAEAKSKWVNANTSNVSGYVFNSRLSCQLYTDPVKIGVLADAIASVRDIQSQNVLPDSMFSYFRTIDQWFDWIGASLDRNPYSASITYDTTLGYPTSIYFDFDKATIDDEFGGKIDSLHLIYRVAL